MKSQNDRHANGIIAYFKERERKSILTHPSKPSTSLREVRFNLPIPKSTQIHATVIIRTMTFHLSQTI